MKNQGQLLIEAQLLITFVMIPFMSGLWIWGNQEYKRAKCAYESFNHAREELIRTQKSILHTYSCGPISETISLVSLEDLDQRSGSGLSIGDWATEVSQLGEELFSLSQSLPEAVSH